MREKGKFVVGLTVLVLLCGSSLQAAPKGLGLEDNTLENIAKKVFASVVKVEARNGFTKVATGVILDKDGYIVTTALVSPRDEKIIVTTSDGKRSEAKFLGLDPMTNLALIQAKEKNLLPIALGKAESVTAGSWVGVISVSPENTPSVTQGIVSSMTPTALRLNVWVTRGSSGSPVVNRDGQMIALLRGIYTEDQPVVFEFREREVVGSGYVFNRAEAPSSGMAYAVPVETVKSVAAEIKKTGKVSRGWMGVTIYENENGQVEIGEVEDESPAELAKLKEGDILLTIDGKRIVNSQVFISEIHSRKPGQDIRLEVERDGKTVEVKVKLGEYPEGEAKRELETRFPGLFPPRPTGPVTAVPPGITIPRTRGKLEIRPWPGWEKRKYIGVSLDGLNKELLDYFGVKDDKGLLVTQLTKDGPAEKAGLKVGDVIVRVDGEKVGTVSDLSDLIQDKKKGDKIKVDLVRDKKPLTIEVGVEEEESPSLAYFGRNIATPERWDDMARELQKQYTKSRGLYEKYSVESRDKLKKLNEEMARKSQEAFEKSRELYEKSKTDQETKLRKIMAARNRIFYRV
ncbi:MAG: PDZ domain-containing protein [Acidobacteriota bacterium]